MQTVHAPDSATAHEKSPARVDQAAFEELYIRYSRPAFGLALRMLEDSQAAEDAVQEAFLRLWRRPESYDPARGPFINWLLAVVRNLCLDRLKSRRDANLSLDRPAGQEQLNRLEDARVNVEEEAIISLQRRDIQAALDLLNHEQRLAIELAFFKGLSHREIAGQTGEPLGTVKSRIRQGLLRLRPVTT